MLTCFRFHFTTWSAGMVAALSVFSAVFAAVFVEPDFALK